MLNNWLEAINLESIAINRPLRPHHWLNHIDIYTEELPNLEQVQIALIGIEADAANRIRRSLYAMTYPFATCKIVDLGNMKRDNLEMIIPVLQDLLDGGIIPIILGGQRTHIFAQYQAYRVLNLPVNMVSIDQQIRYKKEDYPAAYLNKIINTKDELLFNLNIIAYQSHYTEQSLVQELEDNCFTCIRLGHTRNNPEETEPVIRDADLLTFNVDAIRAADAPASVEPSPSGLFTEEACRLIRYAGMSDKMTSIGFYAFDANKEGATQTAEGIAQMVWYFVDGYCNRQQDFPISNDGLVEYIVDFKEADYALTFWKSTKSERWWMEPNFELDEKYKRHQLIPCSYKDYQAACQGELPKRLLDIYKKFGK